MKEKASKYREQTLQDLQETCIELSKEIFKIKNELKTTRKLEKPHRLKQLKRNRARALTVLNEKRQAVV